MERVELADNKKYNIDLHEEMEILNSSQKMKWSMKQCILGIWISKIVLIRKSKS